MAGIRRMSWPQAFLRYGIAVPLVLALASCAVVPQAEAPPAPAPVAAPPPPQAAPAPRPWEDRDLDAGDWRYDEATRSARFIQPGKAAPLLTMQCDTAGRSMVISAGLGGGTGSLQVQLRTSAGVDQLVLVGDQVRLDVQDQRLDRIAFSRGRFALEAANGSHLTLPVYAEIGRVIEECRA